MLNYLSDRISRIGIFGVGPRGLQAACGLIRSHIKSNDCLAKLEIIQLTSQFNV